MSPRRFAPACAARGGIRVVATGLRGMHICGKTSTIGGDWPDLQLTMLTCSGRSAAW